jgi:ribonuclease Z
MSLLFLGTSSNVPTKKRNVSAMAVKLTHENWLFDAGEGTIGQILRSRALRLSRLTRIFITHLHADHIFGLPAVLAEASTLARTDLHVYGPLGIRRFLQTAYSVSGFQPGVRLHYHEFHTHKATFPSDSDFLIPPGSNVPIHEDDTHIVHAGFIRHRIACWGFVVKEKDIPGALQPSKLEEMGIPRGALWKAVRSGLSVTDADGRVVSPAHFLAEPRVGRKLVLLGDTWDPTGMAPVCQDADLLVHESTLPEEWVSRARKWGHSTPSMAASFAKMINARSLFLTHFSPRFPIDEMDQQRRQWPTPEQLAEKARSIYAGPVYAARDFMQVDLPIPQINGAQAKPLRVFNTGEAGYLEDAEDVEEVRRRWPEESQQQPPKAPQK